MKVAILKNEFDDGHENWMKACVKQNIEADIIDLTKNNWLIKIKKEVYDCFLACPSGRESIFKNLYDERIYILNRVLNYNVYPNYDEISLHENKKYLSYWLASNEINHPKTNVFYYEKEAMEFVRNSNLPIVAKFNIGASGKGVRIFRNKEDVIHYIKQAFTGKGLRQSWGPDLKMGMFGSRILKIIRNPKRIFRRLEAYKKVYNETQNGLVIFQEYIPHEFEWRIVKIGNSYFGHKKIKQGDKASGTKGIDYAEPPVQLLNFVKNLCDLYSFNSMAVDLFEDENGEYMINELQCIFGHVQDYICEKDGSPGRFIYKDDNWLFEKGMFNSNLSYDLRLKDVFALYTSK
ncbi:MAG: hypothetical protein JEZ09_01995 [Salinivirgaceae bacterium]|nr:hypothetical protein [Salinivirgaceae bacterium]